MKASKLIAGFAVSAVVLVCASTGAQAQRNPYAPCSDPPFSVPSVAQLQTDSWNYAAEPVSTTCYYQSLGPTNIVYGTWSFNPTSGSCSQITGGTSQTQLACSEQTTAEFVCNDSSGQIEWNWVYTTGGVWQWYAYCGNNNRDLSCLHTISPEVYGCATTWNVVYYQDTGHP